MLRFYCNVKGSLLHYIQNRIYCAKADNVPYYIFTLVIGTLCNQNMFGTEQGLIKYIWKQEVEIRRLKISSKYGVLLSQMLVSEAFENAYKIKWLTWIRSLIDVRNHFAAFICSLFNFNCSVMRVLTILAIFFFLM